MMRVSEKALSVFCPHCQNRLTLESLRITGSHPGKKLSTCGDILVEKTAQLHLELFACRITILGRVRGHVIATESVEVGPAGHVIGDIQAPKIVVREGALIQGRCEMTKAQKDPVVAVVNADLEPADVGSPEHLAVVSTGDEQAPLKKPMGPVPRPLRPPEPQPQG